MFQCTELWRYVLLSSVCLPLIGVNFAFGNYRFPNKPQYKPNCENVHVVRNLYNKFIDWNRIGACE